MNMATTKKQTKKTKPSSKKTMSDCGGVKPPKPLPNKKPKKKSS